MFGLLAQLLIQLLLLKGTHGCCSVGKILVYGTCPKDDGGGKQTTKHVEQTTQQASTRPHRPPKGTTKETTPPLILTPPPIHNTIAEEGIHFKNTIRDGGSTAL